MQREKLRLQKSCPPGHIAGNGGDRNKPLPTVNPLGPRPSSTAPPGRRETPHLLATGPGFERLCAKSLSQEVMSDLPESNSPKVSPLALEAGSSHQAQSCIIPHFQPWGGGSLGSCLLHRITEHHTLLLPYSPGPSETPVDSSLHPPICPKCSTGG